MPARKKTPTSAKKKAAAQKNNSTANKSSAARTIKKDASKVTPPSHIVGIGSSAGGLEALKDFFRAMPSGSGLGFVLVPHLDPSSKSIMHELLQKYTSMPVEQVEEGTRVESDHVYIIPPGKIMGITDGRLHLMKLQEERGRRHPIDYFFRSLAEDQRDNSIGIILSGTGVEGVLGIKAIKGEAGFVMAQEPGSAKFDGMPLNAIGTGLVDFIMSPDEMPAELIRFIETIQKGTVPGKQKKEELPEKDVRNILSLLHRKTGHDFSLYKPKTITRRIERRMAINQIEEVDTYIRFLHDQPVENDLLFRELLIRVTSFFRDPGAFKVLQEKMLPRIFQDRSPDQPLRIWVPACSTGEEAYSIAIVIHEYLKAADKHCEVQLFATDIDDRAVESARRAKYPESISVDVSKERLHMFFTKEGNCYRVNKEIRDKVTFAAQNAVKDPPLSRMDLICCRNLLIYLSSELQARLLTVFHYALNPGGILFLGTSETIGPCAELYESLDSKWKFFKPAGNEDEKRFLPAASPHWKAGLARTVDREKTSRQLSISELSNKMLLDIYAPASVIIHKDGTILYFSGRTGKYLEPAPGKANLNIFNMARQGLKGVLTKSVRQVSQGRKDCYHTGIKIKTNGKMILCNVKVIGINKSDPMKGLMMVVFEDVAEQPEQKQPKKDAVGPKEIDQTRELEEELKDVREELQSTIEQFEASSEELQSSNEELQSTNEELETSREELQSVNEELMTVNAEAQERIDNLTQAQNDMNNLLASTEIATVFLDGDLRIKNFTPAAKNIFNLIKNDVGRPISDITNALDYDHLIEDMQQVYKDLVPREKQVISTKGFWYLMKILPYQTHHNMFDGIILTLIDISKQKYTEAALAESDERLTTILEDSDEAFVLIDQQSGFITDSNPAFQKMVDMKGWKLKKTKMVDLITQKSRKAFETILENEKGSTIRKSATIELSRPNGSAIAAELKGEMITIGDRPYLQCFLQKPGKKE